MARRSSTTRSAAAASRAAGSDAVVRIGIADAIRIVDEDNREIEVCATSEALDTYETVFDYEASKDAFSRWVGNVREMHERKAVGNRVAVRFDDEGKRVYTRIRISKGAPDTWEKIKDGTLKGASIGATRVQWSRQRRAVGEATRDVDVATRYDLQELSLVDNPSNPDGLGISFVRDAVVDDAMLDEMPEVSDETPAEEAAEEAAESVAETASLDHADATLSVQTFGEGQGASVQATVSATSYEGNASLADVLCGLQDLLGKVLAALEKPAPVAEPAPAPAAPAAMAAGVDRAAVAQEVRGALTAAENSMVTRFEGAVRSLVSSRLETMEQRLARIEAQPQPGGPVFRAADRSTPLSPAGGSAASGNIERIAALSALAGKLNDHQAQITVAAEIARLQGV